MCGLRVSPRVVVSSDVRDTGLLLRSRLGSVLSDDSLVNVPDTMVAPPLSSEWNCSEEVLESGECTASGEYIDPIMLSISTVSASGWADSILLSGSSVSTFSAVWYPELSSTDGECSEPVLVED